MDADMLRMVQMMKVAMGWFSSEPQRVERRAGGGLGHIDPFSLRLLALSISCCSWVKGWFCQETVFRTRVPVRGSR